MSHKVFVVEDHQVILDIYQDVIEGIDSLALCGIARTSREALERIPLAQPDIVLVDISLPGMNGIDLLRQLKRNDPGLHVLVISGQDEQVYALRTIEAGADGYLDKLGLLDHLSEAIKKVLAGELYVSGTVETLLRARNPNLLKRMSEK